MERFVSDMRKVGSDGWVRIRVSRKWIVKNEVGGRVVVILDGRGEGIV